jgi:hypothetical protein
MTMTLHDCLSVRERFAILLAIEFMFRKGICMIPCKRNRADRNTQGYMPFFLLRSLLLILTVSPSRAEANSFIYYF